MSLDGQHPHHPAQRRAGRADRRAAAADADDRDGPARSGPRPSTSSWSATSWSTCSPPMSGPLARGSDTPSTVTTAAAGRPPTSRPGWPHRACPTSYVGRVGDDALGRRVGRRSPTAGVTSPGSAPSPTSPTGTCVVLVEPGGERSMLPDAGANDALTPGDLPSSPFRPGRPPAPVRLHAAERRAPATPAWPRCPCAARGRT